jgi:hypothetical protein
MIPRCQRTWAEIQSELIRIADPGDWDHWILDDSGDDIATKAETPKRRHVSIFEDSDWGPDCPFKTKCGGPV